jgi:hypothetical protein
MKIAAFAQALILNGAARRTDDHVTIGAAVPNVFMSNITQEYDALWNEIFDTGLCQQRGTTAPRQDGDRFPAELRGFESPQGAVIPGIGFQFYGLRKKRLSIF